MHQSQFYSALTILVIASNSVNCVPFPGTGTKSSELIDSSLRFPDTSETVSEVNQSEENVKENLIQSGESDGKYGNFDDVPRQEEYSPPTKQYFEKDSTQNEGQQQLSKFYRYGISTRSANPSSSSDSIIFPSVAASSVNPESYNRFPASGFSDRYNRHRPNIPTPQVSIPFNFGFGLPVPPQAPSSNYNRNSQGQGQPRQFLRSGSSNDFLTREQDDLLYQSLVQLFRGLFTRQQPFRPDQQPDASYNKITFTKSPTPTPPPTSLPTIVEKEEEQKQEVKEDGVGYQSLYSGPKLDKSPCPNGMHRTHSGSCHEKSPRKLLNSSG